nr:11330_t:CDS:2 [Entrophospora candida]
MNYRNDKFKDYNFQAGKEAIKYPMTGAPKTYLAVGVIGFVLILNLIRWFYTAHEPFKVIKSDDSQWLTYFLRTQLELYKNMEGDYRWLTDMRCATHGYSCPSGGITQNIESGVYVIDDNRADIHGFIENIFGHLEDRKVRSLLEAKLKAIAYAEGAEWTKDELSTSFEVGGSITGIHYALYSDKIQNQSKRRFFIAIVQNSISAGPGHYFISGYFNGQEERIKNALKYLLYKEAKNKLLIH